ncbi:iron ABC transporter permease [Hydrococcus rivularis NIES-593]|uniref:Iron ABC transporter permease n=2 Tax=Hydrococcus TaxID=1616833 RepID=A0A1U7HBD8_9CYAN|nr:iron ABC transporter permease [Hydrococcus rivularis NIES-593]
MNKSLFGSGFSWHLDRRVLKVLSILAFMTISLMAISILKGEYTISPLEAFKTALSLDRSNPDYTFIINTLRLPRTVVAYLVGVGLAISGTILQGLTRNSLADPSIVGIDAGASLAAVTFIVIFPSAPLFALPLSAFVGALSVALVIYLFAWSQGSSPLRFILIGIGLGAIAGALTSLMLTFGAIHDVTQALIWLTGSVSGRSWEYVWLLVLWLIVLVPLSLGLAVELDALNLGDDIARGLGSRVERQRGLLLLVSVALAAVSVAVAGTVSFVGLIAPHLGRQLVGPLHQGLIPTTAAIGGLIVVSADLLGRTLFAPIELPCGSIAAIVGAPYFLYLLIQNRKR